MRLNTIHTLLKYLSRATPRGTAEEQEFFAALQELQQYAQKLAETQQNQRLRKAG